MAVSRTEGGLGLMSCVRESSPPDLPDREDIPHEPKKRRFRPLRRLRRMFRRKESRAPHPGTVSADQLHTPDGTDPRHGPHHATATEDARRRSGSGLHSGLSLSHDSVFSPEQRSGQESGSELETSSSLSVQRLALANSGVQAELVDAVRRRRPRDDTSDEEDLGLPRSPASSSPTAADTDTLNLTLTLDHILKENVNKSNHSTCSDGSLLSMASSEMDEDSYGQSSGHGSKLSLHDKKTEPGDLEVTSAPLSHSAARHKMAIKPKRTHGIPRKRRSTQLGEVTTLPATPEVNEEANSHSLGRSVSPELPVASGTVSASQLKSASLPPGTAPAWDQSPVKLSRSRSSATNKQLDSTNEQDEPDTLKKEDTTFFGRLLSRRSGKKKKSVEEPSLELPQKRMDEKGLYVNEVTKLGRHHPGSRQRVEPINISQECSVSRTQVFYPPSPPPPDSPPLSPKEADMLDDNTLEGRLPLRKVIPLEVDSSIPKRTFIKKSQSFRRDEALPFVSLDTPSLPIGLGTDLEKDEVEDLNEFTTLEVVDHHFNKNKSEIKQKEITSTVIVKNSEDIKSCEVTVNREDVTAEPKVRQSISLDSIHSFESETVPKKSASSESITHHITIPVGSSIVNITQTVNDSQNALPHGVKPEPRKMLKEGNKEIPNFYPVPAPRLSKRESLEAKPPRVPEFLRVQLNHVDNKPSVNVVLSTLTNSAEDKDSENQNNSENISLPLKEDAEEILVNEAPRKNSKPSEIDVKLEFGNEDPHDFLLMKSAACEVKEPNDPNQIKFIHSVKQWNSTPYIISNPNYSIVSIVPKGSELKKSPENVNNTTNQAEIKSVVVKEMKEKSLESGNCNDVSAMKVVLRQRSFVGDEKPRNILNGDKSSKMEDAKFLPRKKSLTKDIFISDIDKSRKLSLEKLDLKNQENLSELSNRTSREMSSSEDNIVDRNSHSSCDTLGSQDSGDVVLRRKSLSREIIKQNDDEPELLKVFARRSLKVKDSDIPDDLEALNYPPMKSRDSDKENEGGDSPPEERKKIKDHVIESKPQEKTVPTIAYKYQRSVSANNDETISGGVLATSKKDNNSYEKRQRSRTIPDPKIIDPPTSIVTHKVIANIYKEKEVEIISLDRPEENKNEKDENVPKFKRIQQRKEEWEKRAQQAMKKTHP